jgi:hypothetical protein
MADSVSNLVTDLSAVEWKWHPENWGAVVSALRLDLVKTVDHDCHYIDPRGYAAVAYIDHDAILRVEFVVQQTGWKDAENVTGEEMDLAILEYTHLFSNQVQEVRSVLGQPILELTSESKDYPDDELYMAVATWKLKNAVLSLKMSAGVEEFPNQIVIIIEPAH